MKRFNYDDEYRDDFYDHEEDMETKLDFAQLDLEMEQTNQKLFAQVVKMLEKSWLWRFRSEEYKLKKIAESFCTMKQIFKMSEGRDANA